MKRITKKAWFGPKKVGWGLSPKSWEGWLATLIFIVMVTLDVSLLKDFRVSGVVILVILFIILSILTGSKPGSASSNK